MQGTRRAFEHRTLRLCDVAAGQRSVNVVSFSADGELLLTLSTDNAHMMTLWRWRAQLPLCTAATFRPGPQSERIRFSPRKETVSDPEWE